VRFRKAYRLLVAGLAVGALFAADASPGSRTTREDLVGAWRLVDIEVKGAGVREVDPFYGTGCRGLLIYDPSGWFSVQIEGSGRPLAEVPSVRPSGAASDSAARLSAAVLDTYYAYYGTWSFDPVTSTVTHNAKGALYPSEDEATYSQHVEIIRRQLIFSRTQNIAGHVTIQTKRWERVSND
jgi:hypothetical protein